MSLPVEYIRFELVDGLGVLTHIPLFIQFKHEPDMPRDDWDRELLDWLRRFESHLPVINPKGEQMGTVQSLIQRTEGR